MAETYVTSNAENASVCSANKGTPKATSAMPSVSIHYVVNSSTLGRKNIKVGNKRYISKVGVKKGLPVSYNLPTLNAGDLAYGSKWTEIKNTLIREYARVGVTLDAATISNWTANDLLEASKFNTYRSKSNWDSTVPQATAGTLYTAALVNTVINNINKRGSSYCVCHCNYCSCNCNYCTCACNYCNCNCNYEGSCSQCTCNTAVV